MRDHYQQNFRENVSAPTSEFAKKQLEKMGWSEGTGLGKKRDGMTTHIRVKKRKDNVGLGGSDKPDVQAVLGDSEWWKDSLGSTLARLGNKKKDKKKDKKKSKKDQKNNAASKKFTDEELFAATGGARFGMRAGITNNLHKWTRTENDNDQEGSAASDDSKTDEESKSLSEKVVTEETDSKTSDSTKNSKKRKGNAEEIDLSDERAEKKEKKDKKKRRKLEESQASDGDVKVSSSSDSESKKRRKEKKQAKKDKKSKKKE